MNTTSELQAASQSTATQFQQEALRIRPAVDLVENDQSFVMHVEMPGVDQEHANVVIERNVITVQGTTSFSTAEGFAAVAGEVGPRVYERSFQLSDDIDRANIDAQVKHGVLTLTFPKVQRAQKATIPVKGE